MRRLWLFAALVPIAAAGCGGNGASPESVVRAWSHELNVDDNEGAAKLFAPGATIVQGDSVLILHTHADAVRWNASLPCSGQIVSIKTVRDTVTAKFLLGDRRMSHCDGPGSRESAVFRVQDGKIVLWQTGDSPAPPGTV
jgi:limonene-1,2-epoxide hydrolase